MQKKFNELKSACGKSSPLIALINNQYQALNLPITIKVWLNIIYPIIFWGILCAIVVINILGSSNLICNIILMTIWLLSFAINSEVQVRYIPDLFDEDEPESKPYEHF